MKENQLRQPWERMERRGKEWFYQFMQLRNPRVNLQELDPCSQKWHQESDSAAAAPTLVSATEVTSFSGTLTLRSFSDAFSRLSAPNLLALWLKHSPPWLNSSRKGPEMSLLTWPSLWPFPLRPGEWNTLGSLSGVSNHMYRMRFPKEIQACFLLFLGWRMESLCSSGWLRTLYVDQASLELTETCLPLPPNAGTKGVHHCTWLESKTSTRRKKAVNHVSVCQTRYLCTLYLCFLNRIPSFHSIYGEYRLFLQH